MSIMCFKDTMKVDKRMSTLIVEPASETDNAFRFLQWFASREIEIWWLQGLVCFTTTLPKRVHSTLRASLLAAPVTCASVCASIDKAKLVHFKICFVRAIV